MTSAGQEMKPPGVDGKRRARVLHHARRGSDAAKQTYTGSSAEHLWQRLDSMDFINRGMLFAATLLLCFFPFLIIANALAGRSAVNGLARHLGLNKQAAADVSQLFTSATATSNAITGTAWLFFVLGGVAAATAVQGLYERAFDLDARGMKDILRRLIWLAVLVGSSVLAGWVGPTLHHHGGPVVLAVIGLAALTGFWWFSLWLLLAGRIPWRELLPSAIATSVCWLGMEIVFSFTFSSEIITDDKKYGPIGVVFALMSWLIAIGVVIILGAVFGLVWRERRLSFSAAFKKLRRRQKTPVPAGE
jgi:membrane protein